MNHLLQFNLALNEDLITLGKNIIGLNFPTVDKNNMKLLVQEFCMEFQKRYNIFVCTVEGQHRMCASSVAWINDSSSDYETLPVLLKNCNSLRFQLNILQNSYEFQAEMIEISNKYRESRLISVPSSLFHHLILLEYQIYHLFKKESDLMDDHEYRIIMDTVKRVFAQSYHPKNKK